MPLTPLLMYSSPARTQISEPTTRIGRSGQASTRATFRKRCSAWVPLTLLMYEIDSANRR
eukprot:434456-Pleurochrysis_carterae.AAC.1